jgi:hypothetical protein
MKRFLSAIALACVFSISALAGDVPISGVPSPPPSGTIQTTSDALPGDVPSGSYSEQMSDAALSTLLSALAWLVV